MTVYFIRHGDKQPVPGDCPLSALGRRQARGVARCLRGKGIEAIFVSRSLRTLQTADPLARSLGLQPIVDERLDEISNGDAGAMTLEEIRVAYPEVWKNYNERKDIQWPNGESAASAQRRVVAFLEDQYERSGNAAAFAHDAILRVLVCHVWHMPVTRLYEIGIDTAGIIEVQRAEDWQRWKMVRYNQRA